MNISKKTKITATAAATAIAGVATAAVGLAAIAKASAVVAAINMGGAVLGAVVAAASGTGIAAVATTGVAKLAGAAAVAHSSGALMLSGAAGYIPGSMTLLSNIGAFANVSSVALNTLSGANLGNLLASAGVIGAPAWAVPAVCVGATVAVASLGVIIYQNHEEIAGAAANVTQWVREKLTRSDDNGPEFVS